MSNDVFCKPSGPRVASIKGMSFSGFKDLFVETRKLRWEERFDCKDGVLACPHCKSLGVLISASMNYQTHAHCAQCKYTAQIGEFQKVGISKDILALGVLLENECPECGVGSEMVVRQGKYGFFIACTNYPACKWTQNIKEDIDVNPFSGDVSSIGAGGF